jgi:hypothetical protein
MKDNKTRDKKPLKIIKQNIIENGLDSNVIQSFNKVSTNNKLKIIEPSFKYGLQKKVTKKLQPSDALISSDYGIETPAVKNNEGTFDYSYQGLQRFDNKKVVGIKSAFQV